MRLPNSRSATRASSLGGARIETCLRAGPSLSPFAARSRLRRMRSPALDERVRTYAVVFTRPGLVKGSGRVRIGSQWSGSQL